MYVSVLCLILLLVQNTMLETFASKCDTSESISWIRVIWHVLCNQELLVPPQILNVRFLGMELGRYSFLHDVAIDCFTVSSLCFQTVLNRRIMPGDAVRGTKLLRQASEVGLSMGPGCLSFRECLAVVQLSLLYLCYHCYFVAEWTKLHLGHSFSSIRTAQF